MGNIVLLDELTINKIAAGEVIERPASVIKEMIENSIDAGATSITVEIKNGGISYIRVVDNGKGIAADDLEMAFERHATSKIRSADDLTTVKSMGFRGEALASIAAISSVELMSKTADQDTGYKVVVEGGDVLSKEEVGCQNGTIITVQNLFYNTPVRYKFLKKDYTESGYIEDAITRTALVHPEIAFKFINTGKTIIQTTGNGDLKSVIYSIYGKEIAESILEAEYTYDDIIVKGVVGKPEIARSNRSNQIFFVNKRYIKDKNLSAATTEAFKGMIPIGKFGFVILNLEMNSSKVDVNVHPAKLEVRFEEENKVFKAVYHTIKDTLLKGELVSNTSKEPEKKSEKVAVTENAFQKKQVQKEVPQETENDGLFGWRKNRKTNKNQENNNETDNNIISQIYNDKQKDSSVQPKVENSQVGEPVDTFDVLEKLKEIQRNLQKEVEEGKKELQYKTGTTENTYGQVNETGQDYKIGEDVNRDSKKVIHIYNKDEKQLTQDVIGEESNKIENIDVTEEQQNPNTIPQEKQEVEKNNNTKEQQTKENIENEEKTQQFINAEEQQTEKDANIENGEKGQKDEHQEKEDTIEELDNAVEEKVAEAKSQIDELLNNTNAQAISADFTEMYLKTFGTLPPTEEPEKEKQEENSTMLDDLITDNNMSIFDEIEEHKKPTYKLIGIAFKTYIILEIGKELYILDQHATHERILYEKVKKNYYSEEIKDSQMLLLPDVITLTHKEMDIAKDNMKMFEKAGFVLEEFGENTIKLSGVPDMCLDLDTKELFLETLDEINTVARTAKQEVEERFLATVACKAAVKANMALSDDEVKSLLDKLLDLPNPFTCPHGRPTVIKMTKYDIERKFARK